MTVSVAARLRSKTRAPKYLLAIPAIIWYLVFFAAPIAFIVLYSFGTKDTTKLLPVDLSSLSSNSYSSVFDETFFKVFRATLRISIVATIMCVIIGLPVAYFVAFKVTEKWKAIILAAVVVPSFTSFLIRTVAWRIPLAPNGTLSKWLVEMGYIGSNGIQILETATAVGLEVPSGQLCEGEQGRHVDKDVWPKERMRISCGAQSARETAGSVACNYTIEKP